MPLVEQIEKDLVAAMKSREELKLSVLRMTKTALKLKQVEQGKPVDDAAAVAVLRTLAKQRHDSVEHSAKAGARTWQTRKRPRSRSWKVICRRRQATRRSTPPSAAAIAETGASTAKDLGKAMKAAMAKLAGKNADGKRVSEKVRAKLGG